MKRYIAYIDGFSFYNGLTKYTAYKWCDVYALCNAVYPEADVEFVAVNLYAGISKEFGSNPGAHNRQEAYFKALRAQERIFIHTYKYAPQKRWLPVIADLKTGNTNLMRVKSFQEKRVDVELSIQLVKDAMEGTFDCAVVFTNDWDFVGPIRMARLDFGKKVYVVPTVRDGHRRALVPLLTAATNHRFVTEEMLANCQLPDKVIRPNQKPITKPPGW